MLTRRQALLASAFFAGGAVPAAAQPRHPAQQKPGTRSGKKEVPGGSPADTPLGPVDTAARWAFIQDFNTGAALLEKNPDVEMPPSSMTKLMTIYLVYERLKQGKMKLDDELTVSERAWRMGGLIPDAAIKVAESGIRGAADAQVLHAAGYQAVLVGEALMTSGDPAASVAALRAIR